jgi:hypothetical protein
LQLLQAAADEQEDEEQAPREGQHGLPVQSRPSYGVVAVGSSRV